MCREATKEKAAGQLADDAMRMAALEAELKEAQTALKEAQAANATLRVIVEGMETVSLDAIVQVRHSPPTPR